MAHKYLLALVLVLTFSLAAPNTVFAAEQDISIAELSNAAGDLDHQQVSFDGEVVGDIINATDGYYWVTVHDGSSSISVYINQASRDSITHLGNYGQTGDRLQILGEFNLACEQHDGLSDVHAYSVDILENGAAINHQIEPIILIVGVLLIVVGLGLTVLFSVMRNRRI